MGETKIENKGGSEEGRNEVGGNGEDKRMVG